MIKGVVFDFDGVLIDSPKIYFQVMSGFLSSRGVNVSRQEVSRLISFSLRQEFGFLTQKYKLDLSFEGFVKGTMGEAKKLMKKKLELNEGALELLEGLRAENVFLGLASNNNRVVVEWVLQKFGLKHFFEVIVPVELVLNPKPAPDVYLKCASVLGLRHFECVGIEDTVVGCQALKNAGFKCIAFPNQFSEKSDFVGVDLMVDSLKDLNVNKILSLGGQK